MFLAIIYNKFTKLCSILKIILTIVNLLYDFQKHNNFLSSSPFKYSQSVIQLFTNYRKKFSS